MALEATADSKPLQRHVRLHQRGDCLGKGLRPSRCGMHFHRIRRKLLEQWHQGIAPHHLIMGGDQSQWASGQTATTSVATGFINPHTIGRGRNGIGGTDPRTGPRAINGTEQRVELSLSEMGVTAITDAHHQPNRRSTSCRGPGQPCARGTHYSQIGRHINAMNSRAGVKSTEISNADKVLVAGPADQLDPAPRGKGLICPP